MGHGPLGRVVGSFERARCGWSITRRFQVTQQFWYGPRLLSVFTQSEVIADDYDIGLRVSFPH